MHSSRNARVMQNVIAMKHRSAPSSLPGKRLLDTQFAKKQ
jgi:hypothetical protein